MDDIIKKIETFLAFSDDKLEALEKENQKLKAQYYHVNRKESR
ncbi:SP_0009 family protein [Streptococcus didelphis]|uniref:SP_0009 family protein n=1 Tax=Streptococcus didelphis TaxID=102886 RepID=A0ABY9LFB1_9STRE|nr:SP_0009 family protein [Streptococcus didelphis]WMB27623.1 SP_0009 family protein [Streptococcus didelphis]WMB29907.1 SP_0009 family protein [Streptococcus didelphis]